MNNEAKTYQLINDYLNGNLENKEMLAVENRLKSDANFKTYFESQKLANQGIILYAENQIKENLNQIHKKAVAKKRLTKVTLISLLMIAIVGVIAYSLMENNHASKSIVKKEQKHVDDSFMEKEKATVVVDKVSDVEPIKKEEKLKPETLISDAINKNDSTVFKTSVSDSLVLSKEEVNQNINISLPREVRTEETDNSSKEIKEPLMIHECDEYEADLAISMTSTCENKNDGKLVIDSKVEKYRYFLNESKLTQEKPIFSNLKSGEYILVAIDENRCKSKPITFKIESFECDFMIHPNQSIYWEIPLNRFDEDLVTLEIYNAKSGQQVYKKVLDRFSDQTWNGEGLNGNLLPMGNYVYLLVSSTNQIRGNITIVR